MRYSCDIAGTGCVCIALYSAHSGLPVNIRAFHLAFEATSLTISMPYGHKYKSQVLSRFNLGCAKGWAGSR